MLEMITVQGLTIQRDIANKVKQYLRIGKHGAKAAGGIVGNMNNKKLGNEFEIHFSNLLYGNGFWVHLLSQNQAGQPADVIAVKNGKAFLIDCKVCSKRGFTLSRVEENQDLAMQLWKGCGNGETWFALLIGDEIFMVSHSVIKNVRGKSYLSETAIKENGLSLEKWIVL